MNLTDQCHSTWTALKRAKPRSKRRTKLEAELINIQAKRIKQELKRGMKK
jgi:hypothetical protein